MKSKLFYAVLAAMLVLWCTSCSGSVTPSSPLLDEGNNQINELNRTVQIDYNGDPMVGTLLAGKTIVVGTVTIGNDDTYLYVTYDLTGDWYLDETHVHVGETLADFPLSKGGAIPGKFDYAADHDCNVQSYTYTIPLADIGLTEGEAFLIATHAVVCKVVGGNTVKRETAWCDGDPFPGKNWSMYCGAEGDIVIQGDCDIDLNLDLPDSEVCSTHTFPGTESYWSVSLSSVPLGYDVGDGTYLAWCCDEFVYLNPGENCDALLYSTYDPANPYASELIDWNRVNYIVNHKHPDATVTDIQEAIWYFTEHKVALPADPEAAAMVQDALDNGGGFEPGEGEIILVTVFLGYDKQCTFIEVTVECPPDCIIHYDLNLPDSEVCSNHAFPGALGYWDVTLSSVPEGYDVTDGTYAGWCCERTVGLAPGLNCNALLYTTFDPGHPYVAEGIDWNRVNYIINHKHPDATLQDIQDAIWYFTEFDALLPADPEAAAMVQDAIDNGAGYLPGVGEKMLVFVFIGYDKQCTYIEIDVECI